MSTYVLINGKQQGPYSIEQLQGLLATHTISEDALSWRQGMAEWRPVGSWFRKLGPQMTSDGSAQGQPGLGIISFIIGLAGMIGWFVLLVLAAAGTSGGMGEDHPMMVLVGLGMIFGLGLNLMGAIMGIPVLTKSQVPKTLSLIGVSLNVLEFLGIVFLIVLGLAMGA